MYDSHFHSFTVPSWSPVQQPMINDLKVMLTLFEGNKNRADFHNNAFQLTASKMWMATDRPRILLEEPRASPKWIFFFRNNNNTSVSQTPFHAAGPWCCLMMCLQMLQINRQHV